MCFLVSCSPVIGGLGACALTERQFILVLKASHSPDSVLFEQMGCLLHAFTPLFCLQLLLTKSYTSVFLYFFAQPSGLSCFFRVIGPMTACRLMTSTSIFTTCFFFPPSGMISQPLWQLLCMGVVQIKWRICLVFPALVMLPSLIHPVKHVTQ